jgi:hypothetical protein
MNRKIDSRIRSRAKERQRRFPTCGAGGGEENAVVQRGERKVSDWGFKKYTVAERDLDFLVETAFPEIPDKRRMKAVLREDEDFQKSAMVEEKVLHRLLHDEEVFLQISPALFFEILLRRAGEDLKIRGYTLEKDRTRKIPVFDAQEVGDFLNREPLLRYMADMLSSFTKIESYTIPILIRQGIWKRIRFNDLDITSLRSCCEVVEDPHRFAFYKRIGDICLFILGIFPDYARQNYRYPSSAQLRPPLPGETRISPEEYEAEGRKFYRLAADHPVAAKLEMAETFWSLHTDFLKAKKPLNFIAEHYLPYKKQTLFF